MKDEVCEVKQSENNMVTKCAMTKFDNDMKKHIKCRDADIVTAVLAIHILIKSMCVYTHLDTGELLL